MKKTVKLLLINLLVFVGLLAFMELAVRLFSSEIHLQSTSAHIFQDNKFGSTTGLLPNVQGHSFGHRIETDERGFLKLSCAATDTTKPLAILIGDSVTQGVGVATKESFAAQLSCHFQDSLEIINLGLLGYNTSDYQNVVQTVVEQYTDRLQQLVIFYCLNDISYRAKGDSQKQTAAKKISRKVLDWLKSNSYMYIWLKGVAADRSKSYFLHDYALHEQEALVARAKADFQYIQAICTSRGIPLTVLLLPYEYQLRHPDSNFLWPQLFMYQALSELGIPTYDVFDYLATQDLDSRAMYLYGDGIHFSQKGHALISQYILEKHILN